ncbi:TetR family transcriptional regulator [Clostridium sp. MCC353]|uniref:TetR/AcrR family transcriptional regulator n=1 Tax=Clostridium sp. MCC353 TaxID=2592646 RepID=UPI001C01D5AD|nr:TetR/AcrR family transcriptional regulator [Clostridium sp. MCC353]MBT9775123.1 TetR family transcriptional regulator [Clostridium sp. MCC353]
MRIVKEADVRKNEILDAAGILFSKKGYENTSVSDIMNAVGIAKGTLYHHFKSKEDIMDALIKRETDVIFLRAKKTADDKSIPVKERIIRTILAFHVDTEHMEGQRMMEQLHKPQNTLMHEKTKKIVFQGVPPILAGIVMEGVQQGIFETSYPLECMEMALCYLDVMLDDNLFELTQAQCQDKIQAFLYHLERLLGTGKGELASFEKALAGRQAE